MTEVKEKLVEEIKDLIKSNSRTTLSFEDLQDNNLSFSTRENGDVGAEEYAMEDFEDAETVLKELENTFKDKIEVDIETVDEWVHLNVTIL